MYVSFVFVEDKIFLQEEILCVLAKVYYMARLKKIFVRVQRSMLRSILREKNIGVAVALDFSQFCNHHFAL